MSVWEGSAWQEAIERQRERTAKTGRSGCGHPGCDIEDRPPTTPGAACTQGQPISIYVAPGKHAHIACPVHPDGHVIRG